MAEPSGTSDLPTELRALAGARSSTLSQRAHQAADELERLAADNSRLRAELHAREAAGYGWGDIIKAFFLGALFVLMLMRLIDGR